MKIDRIEQIFKSNNDNLSAPRFPRPEQHCRYEIKPLAEILKQIEQDKTIIWIEE